MIVSPVGAGYTVSLSALYTQVEVGVTGHHPTHHPDQHERLLLSSVGTNNIDLCIIR